MASAIAYRWSMLDRIIEWIRYEQVSGYITQNSLIVDMGCGDGHFLRQITTRYPTVTAIGIDIAAKRYDGLNIIRADLNQTLPISNNTVDIVTAMAVIEHLYNYDVFISEIYRVLRYNGKLLLTTPSPAAKPLLESLSKMGCISRNDINDHKHYFSETELRQLLHMFTITRIDSLFGLTYQVVAKK